MPFLSETERSFLSAAERAFLSAVSQLAYSNPFLPERAQFEHAALGADYVEGEMVWSLPVEDPERPRANVWRINARLDPLVTGPSFMIPVHGTRINDLMHQDHGTSRTSALPVFSEITQRSQLTAFATHGRWLGGRPRIHPSRPRRLWLRVPCVVPAAPGRPSPRVPGA